MSAAGRGVEGMVYMVGNVASKPPVVATVLEQVHDGHSGIREPVDEDCL